MELEKIITSLVEELPQEAEIILNRNLILMFAYTITTENLLHLHLVVLPQLLKKAQILSNDLSGIQLSFPIFPYLV